MTMAAMMGNPRAGLDRLNALARKGVVSTSFPYWSRFFFTATKTGAGPFTYPLTAGTEVRAFGYAKGQDMSPVGRAGTSATSADTNLIKPSTTLNGQTVEILGIGIQLNPTCDFELARLAAPEMSVSISLNGDDTSFFLGTPIMIPGAGGLYGNGNTMLRTPDLASTVSATSGASAFLGANGYPMASNLRMLPESLFWRPEGKPDASLVVKLRLERSVTVGAVATRAAAAGVGAYDPPATASIDGFVQLWCRARADLSVNT